MYARSGKQVLKIDKTVLSAQMCSFKLDDVTINLVYRPPSAAAESITELADAISDAGSSEVFIGDFNLPGIDWVGAGGHGRGREPHFV